MGIRISAIAAMSKNGVIGRDNAMPWHLSEDLKNFKRTTTGKPVIMGRKTYESLGRPLPGRVNIVISRTPDNIEGDVFAVDTLEKAIDRAAAIANADGVSEIFIIGGAQIYAEAMRYLDRLYLTMIDQDYEGDAHFPVLNPDEWTEISRQDFTDPQNFSIRVLEKK